MSKRAGNPTDFESFLTWEALTEVLSYDPARGEFRWIKSGRLGWVNRLAGTVDSNGYRRIEILGRMFFASRLAWLYMTKKWPARLIDHKNGNRSDDRWDNLRQASRVENARNRAIPSNNTSGTLGVYWKTTEGKWAARGTLNGKRTQIGLFDTLEEAVAARKGFEVAHFGEFQREESDVGIAALIVEQTPVPTKVRKIARRGIPSDFESMLTQEIIVRLLSYNPVSGEFVWRSNETNPRRIKVGQSAGVISSSGYVSIQIMGRKFVAHRLAWLYMVGRWPTKLIDHINQNKQDNRWENLREVSRRRNAINVTRRDQSSSGERHIYPHGTGYRVWFSVDRKGISLGTFPSLEEAVSARDEYVKTRPEYLTRRA